MSILKTLDGTVEVKWSPKRPGFEAKAKHKHIGSVWQTATGWWCESIWQDQFSGPYPSGPKAKEAVEMQLISFCDSNNSSVNAKYGFKADNIPPVKKVS